MNFKKLLTAAFALLLLAVPCFADADLTIINSNAVFRAYIGNENSVMLDLRPEEAYMGWIINGAVRGGHVTGAKDFPASWLDLLDVKKLDEVLTQKGVAEGKTVVLYG
ncbi:MAG: hypothetical protein IJ667_13350, partial [Synergistaceae bacterium]|nr:hypothetical protein [Synergistaceae bacterium]